MNSMLDASIVKTVIFRTCMPTSVVIFSFFVFFESQVMRKEHVRMKQRTNNLILASMMNEWDIDHASSLNTVKVKGKFKSRRMRLK